MPEVYSQEYLNVPIDESTSYFRRSDFLPIREEDRKTPVHYYLTGDMAISDKERADYTVFVIAAVDENKRIQIRNVIRERMDGREIVDTLLALQKTYNFEAVGLEEGQISKSIGPFLREAMVNQNTYLSLAPLKHMSLDKLTRARSIQARMRAGGVKFDKEADWYPTFENECIRFPRDRHDDQVDAFSYMGLMLDRIIESPTRDELIKQKYDEDLEESGINYQGRNHVTGY
jgi:predicted phage terminase large subunit-like protein